MNNSAMKKLEGKDVYLEPSGYNNDCFVVKAKILKVARVNVTFIKEGSSCQEKYRISDTEPLAICNDCNDCYRIYADKQELNDKHERERIVSLIFYKYPHHSSYKDIDLDVLRQIAALLKVDIAPVKSE